MKNIENNFVGEIILMYLCGMKTTTKTTTKTKTNKSTSTSKSKQKKGSTYNEWVEFFDSALSKK